MADDGTPPRTYPAPEVRRRGRLPSLIWGVPLAAALIGLSLLVHAWRASGPRVQIAFQTAQGVEIGKTLIKFRNVTIGHVSGVELSRDRSHVLISADLERSAEDLLTADARFWVVRPRLGVGSISGLETLISGAYIAMESGESPQRRRNFIGLENPPPLSHGPYGKEFVLDAQNPGSVSRGVPVYFRRFLVGRVIDEGLERDGRSVRVVIFVDAPYDRFITRATRFWNASGMELAVDAEGMRLKTESLASIIGGGIAFDTPATEGPSASVPAGERFALFESQREAMAPPLGEPHYVKMRFHRSLRGLSVGAPVEFIGVNIGRIVAIDLDYDPRSQNFPLVVTAALYPQRMGPAYQVLVAAGAAEDEKMARLVGVLVARGLRAQPRPANLLTGQLYLSLDFVPRAPRVSFDVTAVPLEIPTVPGGMQEVQQRVTSILAKLDELPLGHIAQGADRSLASLNSALTHIDEELLPGAQGTLSSADQTLQALKALIDEDSPTGERLRDVLGEAQRTLRSVRSLSDLLERHPEALIRGRKAARSVADVPAATEDSPP
jgi:paraquat-inducible protein B